MKDPDDREVRLRVEAEAQNRRVSAEQGEGRDRFYFLAERAFARYRQCLADVAGKRVLVVGCSQGGVTPLARAGATVVGIDVAEEPVARLRAAIAREGLDERAHALVMDAETADFAPASFDVICCTGVLHHLDVERVSLTWARLLADTGTVVMIEPMAWSPAATVYRWLTPAARTPFEHPLKPRDIRLLRRHFAAVDLESYALTSTLAAALAFPRLSGARRVALRALETLDDAILRAVPPLAYLAWTCVIRCQRPVRSA
ncbi:methyltransferase domain-containing protein [Candidatus Binatia bacterium]|nr:methyltransferase domain-containing protein [Candidatus Binatia bacterium]